MPFLLADTKKEVLLETRKFLVHFGKAPDHRKAAEDAILVIEGKKKA